MDGALRDLLREVAELEIVARRNVSSLLAGNYLTTVPGQGLEFHEARRYVQGESVRRIDWKMTARQGVPWVRTFLEERQREVFLALDVSLSMATGWQEKTKLEAAVEMAATFALSATEAGDRVGLVTFSDRAHEVQRPRAGRKQLFRVLKSLAGARSAPVACERSDPRAAVHAVERHRGRRFVVLVISDFIDHDVPEDLKYFRRRHDVTLVHVYDPLEYEPAAAVRLPAFSPEGGRGWTSLAPGEAGGLDDMVGFLAAECARYGITFGSFSTREPVYGGLVELFQKKRRRLYG